LVGRIPYFDLGKLKLEKGVVLREHSKVRARIRESKSWIYLIIYNRLFID
jgi:hypothetical protein